MILDPVSQAEVAQLDVDPAGGSTLRWVEEAAEVVRLYEAEGWLLEAEVVRSLVGAGAASWVYHSRHPVKLPVLEALRKKAAG